MKRTASLLAIVTAFAVPAFAADITKPDTGGELMKMESVMPKPVAEAAAPAQPILEPKPVLAAHHLRPGDILHGSDLVTEGDPKELDFFVGMQLKRAVYAGKVITASDVGLPTVIERNAIVSLEFVRGPLMIATEGRALDAGAVGDTVRVMNLNSKVILTAVVTGPNKAKTQ